MSNAFYQLHKKDVKVNGLLTNKVFPRNIRRILNDNNVQYTVIEPYTTIICDSNICTIYKDNIPRTITTVKYKTGGPQTVNPDINDPNIIGIEVYVFDTEICEENLLSSKVEISKDTLSNGLCANRMIETTYTDYQFDCCEGNIELRSSSKKDIDISLHPNPLNSDLMKIRLPDQFIGNDVDISIHTIEGKLIKQYNTYIGAKQLTVKVGKYLENQGLYIMRFVSKDKILSKKFYFINNK